MKFFCDENRPDFEIKYVDIFDGYSIRELGYEYSCPLPNIETDYSVSMNENQKLSGKFEDVFLRDENTWGERDSQINEAVVYNVYGKLVR